MQNVRAVTSTTVLLFLIGACGGGSSSVPVPPIPTASKATIDSGNSQAVASRSINAALQSVRFTNVTGVIGLTASKSASQTKLGVTIDSKISGLGTVVAQIPVGPETKLCAVRGSVTISGEIASPTTLTVNDFFDIDWDNCDDGNGAIIDGLLGLTVTSFEGDRVSGQMLLGSSLRVANLLVTSSNEFSNANGDVSFTLDTLTPPLTIVTTSGSSFEVSSVTSAETLSNFSSTVTDDASAFPSTVTTVAMGTITSTQFDGEVTYETPVAFEALGDAYPHSGELLVTGANNATVRLIALDEVNVRIEADYDGDGTVDETIDTTWDALIDG